MSADQRRITLTEEDDWWVATDESVGEHGVTSQGRTRQEALENLDEAVALYNGETGRPPTDDELREWDIDPEDNRRRRGGDGELPDVLK
jgi:predicted RNase H-like HicB family nuclease